MVEGETATMQCKVKNPKNYPITWHRNGEEIKPGDKFVEDFFRAVSRLLYIGCMVRRSGNGVGHVDKVKLRRARLLLGLV